MNLWIAAAVLGFGVGTQAAETFTLGWTASAGASGYRVYTSTAGTTFAMVAQVSTTTASVPVSTNSVSLFYVTAFNSAGESPPSNIWTNTPADPTTKPPILTLMPPTLNTTNVIVGSTVQFMAIVRNDGGGELLLAGGALTLLPPGATRADGPYIQVTTVGPQTIGDGVSVVVNGSWLAQSTVGQWSAYMAVKDPAGTWVGGPATPFTVTSGPPMPTVPLAPTNLRAVAVTQTRLDISWQGTLTASTEVERAKEAETFRRIATVAPGTLHFSDTIQRRRDYRYRVRAKSGAGVSAYSDVVSYHP